MVFDTETDKGIPYLLIFYDGNKITYLRVDIDTILNRFIKYLLEHCSKRRANILFAHNLQFDLTAVLCKYENEIFHWRKPPRQDIYDVGYEGDENHFLGSIRLFCEKQWWAQIKLKNGAYVKVVDSANFFKDSLYNISRALGFKYVKRERPCFVKEGRAPRNRKEWQLLYPYCGNEIKAEFELAQHILGIHQRYDVGFSVSQAQLGSKIFRKHFLKELIQQIHPYIRKIAELTIHGGRANTFIETPIVLPNVKMYDYNSFYPYAMTKLPALTKGAWLSVNDF